MSCFLSVVPDPSPAVETGLALQTVKRHSVPYRISHTPALAVQPCHVRTATLTPQVIRNFEFYTGRTSGRLYKFEVLITTFELVLKDAATLGKVKWNYLMVDEAHRLKNHESALYQARPGPLRHV